ncbi:MAG: signal peptide peptidase SppA [Planctomycetes bacterium]|nr:signal peptide peptidase SppA [Planctomycetota bacterium]
MFRFVLMALIFVPALIGCTINASVFGNGNAALSEATVEESKVETNNKILLISIDGTITSADSRSLLGGSSNTVDSIRRQLNLARDTNDIKAVLLRVNSPGGGATASDTILHELKSFKEDTGLPVVAFFQEMAASGGYYISMCADEIVAQPTALTGSIGVIAAFYDVVDLLNDIGVQTYVIRSDKSKASLSPLIKKSEEDLRQAEDMVQKFFAAFLERVADGRPKLSRETIRKLADGRVYFADEAKSNGLIDSIGYFNDAFERAKKLANVEHANLVTFTTRVSDVDRTYYTEANATPAALPAAVRIADQTGLLTGGPKFLYYWDGN